MQYSTTQTTNLVAIAGVVSLLLNQFGVHIASEELQTLFGAVLVLGGVVSNWYHRYQQGDLTLGGFRKPGYFK